MITKTNKSGAGQARHKARGAGGKSAGTGAGKPDFDSPEHSLEERIVDRLSGISTIESDIAGLVRKTVSDTLRMEGQSAEELSRVVNHAVLNTIRAAEHMGYGMSMSIRSVAKGIIMGVHDVNGDITEASSQTIRSVIRHGAALGSDIGLITRHAVDGMIEGTLHTGGDIASAGKNALEGAIEEASKISRLAVSTVRQALIGIVGSKECRPESDIIIEPQAARHARRSAGREHHQAAGKAH